MDEVKKKLIVPVLILTGMLIVNFNSLLKGIERHETWRIAVASAAYVIIVPLVALVWFRLLKMKKAHASSDNESTRKKVHK
ncbi:MAG TPA: hypothetical protein VHC47_04945 [Mucilaginibacter sp.]|nr:hypothetical protein [Mucilaginibacter sp.]